MGVLLLHFSSAGDWGALGARHMAAPMPGDNGDAGGECTGHGPQTGWQACGCACSPAVAHDGPIGGGTRLGRPGRSP